MSHRGTYELKPLCLALLQVAADGEFLTCKSTANRLNPTRFVLWFITGLLALVACRSLGLIPTLHEEQDRR